MNPIAGTKTSDAPPLAPPPPPPPNDGGEKKGGPVVRVREAVRAGGWPFGAALAAVVVLALAVGAASSRGDLEDARAESAGVRSELTAAESERDAVQETLQEAQDTIDDLDSTVARLEAELDDVPGELEAAQEAGAKAAEDRLAQDRAANDARSAELDQRSAGLDGREAAIAATEAEIDANTFGNGVWEVGVDIQPGKYKTSGSSFCYWSKNDASGGIIDNDIVDGPSTVMIESSVFTFTSNDCGQWTRVP